MTPATAPADQLTARQRERIEKILASLTWEEKLNQIQITFATSQEACLAGRVAYT